MLPALSLPESAEEAYGSIRAELESRGEMIGNNDLWIAAHAIVAGLTLVTNLVTNNEDEFRRVRGLKIQNWAASQLFEKPLLAPEPLIAREKPGQRNGQTECTYEKGWRTYVGAKQRCYAIGFTYRSPANRAESRSVV